MAVGGEGQSSRKCSKNKVFKRIHIRAVGARGPRRRGGRSDNLHSFERGADYAHHITYYLPPPAPLPPGFRPSYDPAQEESSFLGFVFFQLYILFHVRCLLQRCDKVKIKPSVNLKAQFLPSCYNFLLTSNCI